MSREILNKIIRNRKTIYPKQFSGEELSKDLINEILENAIHAPTHKMTQPWFFKVYKGESKGELSSLIKKIDQESFRIFNSFVWIRYLSFVNSYYL